MSSTAVALPQLSASMQVALEGLKMAQQQQQAIVQMLASGGAGGAGGAVLSAPGEGKGTMIDLVA